MPMLRINHLHLEAAPKLIYTEYPLGRIAGTPGFKNPAYFSRFFKKLEEVTPIEYRRDKEDRNRSIRIG